MTLKRLKTCYILISLVLTCIKNSSRCVCRLMLYYNGLGLEVGTWHGCQQGHTTKMPPNPKYQDLCPIPKSHEEENQLLKVISWPPHEHLWHAHGCSHSHMHTHTLVRFNTLIYFVYMCILCVRGMCVLRLKDKFRGQSALPPCFWGRVSLLATATHYLMLARPWGSWLDIQECWDYRHIPLCLAFYMDSEQLNSEHQAFMTDILPTKPSRV
jgi:hypothetical protein